MDLRDWLAEGFEYDLWANKIWLDSLDRFQDLGQANRILEHIHNAQRIWLERCGGVAPANQGDEHLSAIMERMARAWQALIAERDLDETIDYKNLAGKEFSNTLGEIALHVVNHGTYHRGHLRGVADKEGLDDFGETDLILFFRERPR
jgi:uncharacterized damage-inducible protein DinB